MKAISKNAELLEIIQNQYGIIVLPSYSVILLQIWLESWLT